MVTPNKNEKTIGKIFTEFFRRITSNYTDFYPMPHPEIKRKDAKVTYFNRGTGPLPPTGEKQIVYTTTPWEDPDYNSDDKKKAIFTYFEDGQVVYTCRPNDNSL
jgi:hypothetical protein